MRRRLFFTGFETVWNHLPREVPRGRCRGPNRFPGPGWKAATALLLLLGCLASVPAGAQSLAPALAVEPLTLGPDGFEPAEMTRPQGPFILALVNRSGVSLEQLNLALSRQAGPKLTDARLRRGVSGWRVILDLPPGSYVISIQERPQWTFSLIITAQ